MSTRNGRSYLDMSHKIMAPKNHQKGFNKFRNYEKIEKIKHSYSIPQFQLGNINNSKQQIKDGWQGFENHFLHRNLTIDDNLLTKAIE